MSFLIDNISHMLSLFVAGGTKHVPCDSTERELLEVCAWFPLNFAPYAFLFADFGLHHFAVINHSHEYDCVLSPAS